MILRRLTQHVKNQNWTAIALEFLIVVLGVFLGLQASNWNETRQLSARETVLKGQLITDVNLILDETREKITLLEGSSSDIEWLMAAFAQPDVSLTEDDLEAHGSILHLPAPAERSPAYLEAQNSGGLSLIKDADLRTALVKWDRQMEATDTTQLAIREYSRAYIGAIVRLSNLYGVVPMDEALEQSGSRYEFIIALSTLQNVHGASLAMFREIEVESEALLAALKAE
jgi:hypothetical protein